MQTWTSYRCFGKEASYSAILTVTRIFLINITYIYIYIVEVYNTLHGPSGVVHYELSGVAGGDITQQWPNETQGV